METIKITSCQNQLVKFIVNLQNPKFRKEQKLILVDGEKTIKGLIDDGIVFEYVFLKENCPYLKDFKAKQLVLTTNEVLKKISTTKTPTEIVGIIKEKEVDKNIFKNFKHIALIDGIKDAGNLGTIIRSAAAFSIDGIILFNDCVDLYNSKVIRSSAQNMFKIPILRTKDLDFIKELKKTHKLISTVVNTENELFEQDFSENFIIALGSEANGLSKEIIDISDTLVTIKMDNNVESINLGVCASISFALIKSISRFRK